MKRLLLAVATSLLVVGAGAEVAVAASPGMTHNPPTAMTYNSPSMTHDQLLDP